MEEELKLQILRYKTALLFACRNDRDEQFIERCTVDRAELNYALLQADKMHYTEQEDACSGFYNE
jgi:hypothetical protein